MTLARWRELVFVLLKAPSLLTVWGGFFMNTFAENQRLGGIL